MRSLRSRRVLCRVLSAALSARHARRSGRRRCSSTSSSSRRTTEGARQRPGRARARGRVHRGAVQGRRPAAGRHRQRLVSAVRARGRTDDRATATRLRFRSRGRIDPPDARLELLPAGGDPQRRSPTTAVALISTTCRSCSLATASVRRPSNYDDYAGIDVKGKAVLIFSHEPQETRRDSRLNGDAPAARDDARRPRRRPRAAAAREC